MQEPNVDFKDLLTGEGQRQVVDFIAHFRDTHGPAWLAEFKDMYPDFCWIVELVATKTADQAFAEVCKEYPLAILAASPLKTFHTALRCEIDKKR